MLLFVNRNQAIERRRRPVAIIVLVRVVPTVDDDAEPEFPGCKSAGIDACLGHRPSSSRCVEHPPGNIRRTLSVCAVL